jgi:hypothetical protein
MTVTKLTKHINLHTMELPTYKLFNQAVLNDLDEGQRTKVSAKK